MAVVGSGGVHDGRRVPVAIPADGLQLYVQFDDRNDLVAILKAVDRLDAPAR